MQLLNLARYIVFKLIDEMKSDSILKRMRSIENINENDESYNLYIEDKLKSLVNHSINSVEYYRSLNCEEFKNFPVLGKKVFIDNYSKFVSSKFHGLNLHEMSTSGSTGIPFKILQDSGKRNQVLAEIMYFSGLVGYKTGKKLVYLRNLEQGTKKSKIKQFIQNQDVVYTSKYSDDAIKEIYEKISDFENNTTILGYASTLTMISNYMIKNNLKLSNITGIISGAEALDSKTRKKLNEVFNCPIVSRYSNQENGILGQDYEENKFLINRACYYIEIFKMDTDELADYGEIGRIVVTDLYNYAMPMIRYDTGDLGAKEIINGKEYLVSLQGRKADLLFNSSKEPMTCFALDDIFEYDHNIMQYQIVQNSYTDICINLIVFGNYRVNENETRIKIKKILGDDMNITFNYLNELPITNAGKFRYVIRNFEIEQ